MKTALITIFLSLVSIGCLAQTQVNKMIDVTGQSQLVLDLPFADEIRLSTWNKHKVEVQAAVTINDGKDDKLFALKSHKSSHTISVAMDKDKWKKYSWQDMRHCQQVKITYRVYLPDSMQVSARTIDGSYLLDYYNQPLELKTVSGDIDMSVPAGHGVDFRAKTVSGEVYSNLDIEYPDGKDGLQQLVGINVHGRAFGGGPAVVMKTVSGSVYLRNK